MLINRNKFRKEPTSFFKDIKIINVLLGYITPEEELTNHCGMTMTVYCYSSQMGANWF